jgi:ACS family hexuronate transporter-like MFS transporter
MVRDGRAVTPGSRDTSEAGRYRWLICALLFFATTINYVDRQVLGVLAPELQKIIGWNELQYSYIVAAFQGASAFGLLLMGGVIDRIGARIGYALAIAIRSLSAMSHALVQSALGFGLARFFLGLGESGNFPAAIKTVAEWFPRKQRSLATGLFNSGSNIGAIIAPLPVPWIAVHLGWRWAFVFTGVFSAIWLTAWFTINRTPAKLESEPEEPSERIAWARLFPHRQTWDIGGIGGGWLSTAFLKLGWNANRARKSAMLLCAVLVTPIVFAGSVSNLRTAVGLIGLAAASHQGWSANLFTLTTDMFPRRAVASVVGIGGFGGTFSGMFISGFIGMLLQFTGSYVPIFMMAGSVYLVALLCIHILAPRLEPTTLD